MGYLLIYVLIITHFIIYLFAGKYIEVKYYLTIYLTMVVDLV